MDGEQVQLTAEIKPGYQIVGNQWSISGQTVKVYYLRAGQHYETQTKLLSAAAVKASQKTNNPKGYLGIVPTEFTLQRSTWSAPVVAVGLSAQVTALTFQGAYALEHLHGFLVQVAGVAPAIVQGLGHAIGGLGSLVAGALTGNTTARQNGQSNASSQVGGPVAIFVILKDGSLIGY